MGKHRSPRRYSPEFKRDAVALLHSSGRPIKEVAMELGVSDTTLGAWSRAEANTLPGSEENKAQKIEATSLRKRIRELLQEIDILKRFTSYWVSEQAR
jgi:transposase